MTIQPFDDLSSGYGFKPLVVAPGGAWFHPDRAGRPVYGGGTTDMQVARVKAERHYRRHEQHLQGELL